MQLNRERLAEFLGVSLRTIDEYRRQGMPGEGGGHGSQWRFDSAVCVTWLRERERTNAIGDIARIDESEARKRKLAAEAAMAELDLATKEGAVATIADFEASWFAMIGAARSRLLGIGSGVGPELALADDAAECAALVDAAIAEALQELSEFEPNIPNEPAGAGEPPDSNPAGGEVVGATAGPDRKRVGGRRAKAQR